MKKELKLSGGYSVDIDINHLSYSIPEDLKDRSILIASIPITGINTIHFSVGYELCANENGELLNKN